jgi:hypothetical protein
MPLRPLVVKLEGRNEGEQEGKEVFLRINHPVDYLV